MLKLILFGLSCFPAFADETDRIVDMMNKSRPGIEHEVERYPNYWDHSRWPSGMITSAWVGCQKRLAKLTKATQGQQIIYCTCTTDALVAFHKIERSHIERCISEMNRDRKIKILPWK